MPSLRSILTTGVIALVAAAVYQKYGDKIPVLGK